MSDGGAGDDEARERRVRHPVVLAVATGGYVLAGIAGLLVLTGDYGPALPAPLWIVHAVLLVLLIRKLGAKTSSTYTMLFIVATSVMSVYVADMARDDLTLQQRGERVTVTVVKKWRDAAEGRKARDYNYTLRQQDGTKVPGPAMRTSTALYEVGQKVTVIEDPQGELRPKSRDRRMRRARNWGRWGSPSPPSAPLAGRHGEAGMRPTGTSPGPVGRESRRRSRRSSSAKHCVRTLADRRSYIKVPPEDYPSVSQQCAARIAWELGLRAEATGNRGSWRFAEKVVEEVPLD